MKKTEPSETTRIAQSYFLIGVTLCGFALLAKGGWQVPVFVLAGFLIASSIVLFVKDKWMRKMPVSFLEGFGIEHLRFFLAILGLALGLIRSGGWWPIVGLVLVLVAYGILFWNVGQNLGTALMLVKRWKRTP